ncbi:MAG: alpha-2-macroglobulin family protein [Ignavibacteriae bacterium]|nr:alpha-2-macroglobulin family protein [Ignavibacteriota bacterium]
MNFPKITFAVLMILIYSCSSQNTVKVVDFSPNGEIEKATNFTVEFSQDLAPEEKIGEWLTDEFISFEPKINGKFKWLDARTLQFSPDFALDAMQNYSAKITTKVLFNKNLSTDFETYNFNTPHFDVTKAEFFWTQIPHKSYVTSIQTNLHFNYPVQPQELSSFLTISIDGKNISNFEITTTSSSNIISINLGEIKQTSENQNISVEIKKDLKSILGKDGLAENRNFEYELLKITKLDITDVVSGFDGNNGWIDIYLNQAIIKENVNNYLTLEPKTEFETQVYDNHIKIITKNQNENTFTLKVNKGLQGLYGGSLDRDYERVVSLFNVDPSINFSDKQGKYLMLPGLKNLTANIVNIDAVDIEVSQIQKNNIMYFKNNLNNDYWGYYSYDYYMNPHESEDSYGKALYKEKVKLNSSQNWMNTININLEKAVSQNKKGIFLVEIISNEERWIKDRKIVAVSDFGIITKKAKNEMLVFVNSISNAEPIEGANVEIYSTHNTSMLKGVTDKNGVAKFSLENGKYKDESPRIIFIEKENDFNYLDLRESYVETSRFNVGGLSDILDNYTVFMYAERNLYRPGEKVNLSGILRNEKMEIISDEPVLLKIISPTGKVFEEFPKTLNEQGSFEQSFVMPTYAQTGLYKAELYNGAKKIISYYNFNVEDFVPDKIRVNFKIDKQKFILGESVKLNLESEFLFGAKASKLKYEGEIQFRQTNFRSNKFKDFTFDDYVGENSSISNYTFDGTLDENGSAEIDYTIPEILLSGGKISAYAYVSVFDLTGRTVNRVVNFDIFTKNNFIGIKSPDYYLNNNQNYNFEIVSVDKDDKPSKSFNGIAKLVRYKWDSVLRKDYDSRNIYTSVKSEIVEWEKEISISGVPSKINVNAKSTGQYELRISEKGNSAYYKTEFYVYGWSDLTVSNFDIDKEGSVEIVLDKTTYEPNEKVKAIFKCPFSGKLLLTLERKGIYEYKYIDVKNNSAQTEFELSENYLPNVFISATLFKPHGKESESPFLVGHGFASIKIEKKANKLPVKIIASEKVKPNTTQEITIKTNQEKNIYVTIAAVDEGILQIKNFVTPNAYNFMYADRPLNVESYDLYSLLLPEVISKKSSTGGDELASQLKKRVNPVTSKRYKLLSYWSGIKKTNSNGEVKINLPIPQFNGELRLMALVYSGPKFGSADKSIKVSDDLILESQIPRFLSSNDKIVSNISLVNTTNKKSNVKIKASVSGPIEVISEKNKTVEINPNSTATVQFNLSAKNEIGNAKIIFETEGLAKIKEEINIGIRPASPLVVESGSGEIKAGDKLEINLPNYFIKSTQSSTLTISKLPVIKFAKQLKYLLGYPYGCVEQTVSKVFPQLYFGDIAKNINPKLFENNNSIFFVNEGIKKLESMQLYDGSISYWQGSNESNFWGTVYATHFLVEAKKAGFYVDENVFSKLISYLGRKVKEKNIVDYVTYSNNQKTIIKIAQKEIIYALYVLALTNKGDISTMNYYKAMPQLLTNDTKYLLAGAFALMEKRNSFAELIPNNFNEEKTERLSGGCFDSNIRANAIMLNVLLEVDPSNLQIPIIVKYLSQNSENIYSTQETSFTFLALGKALKSQTKSDLQVDVISNGKNLGTYKNSDITISNNNLHLGKININAKGEGRVYYFWNTEGISTKPDVKIIDSQMKVRRTYYNYKTKNEITNNKFIQGDLIVCKISLTGGQRSAENIVISDLIPAGFEIENPRLSTSTNFNWENKNPLYVQYMDVRDDRLILFTNLNANKTNDFYYMLRVVNKGEYQLPVIAAEAMYDREYHSFNGNGKVVIE